MRYFKNILTITLSFFTLYFFTSCAPSPKKAAAYNDTIVQYQTLTYKTINNFFASLDKAIKNPNVLDTIQQQSIENISLSIKKINNLGAFYKDSMLLNAADTLFATYKYIVENDFTQIIKLYKIPVEKYTNEEQKKLELLIKHSQDSLNIANAKFIEYQEVFAKNYNLELK